MNNDPQITALERRVKALERVLGTLIVWVSQSANGPLRVDEAEQLLRMFPKKDT